jgi:hypothetical protein
LEFNSRIFLSPSSRSRAETGREKEGRLVKNDEVRRNKALSAKSRGLARKLFLVGEAFPSQSNAGGSKRFNLRMGRLS